jgi:tRNA (guanine-N(7)-)-methyltransferase subunit TRM82
LAGDRSGDVYIYSLEAKADSGQLLMGHISLLLDMDMSPDEKFLVTCDRDEKIRVSHFPNCYNIQSYCLGHTEFVSSLVLVDIDLLLSGSGDGTLRLWRFKDGQQVVAYDCSQDLECESKADGDVDGVGVGDGKEKPAIKRIVRLEDKSRVAVSFYKFSTIIIYAIDSGAGTISLGTKLKLTTEPLDMKSTKSFLWVLTSRAQDMVQCFNGSSLEKVSEGGVGEALKQVNSDSGFDVQCLSKAQEKEVDFLYKRWYDNVEAYQQKKKEREEEKAKKKMKIK